MRITALIALGLALTGTPLAADVGPPMPGWMAGAWGEAKGDKWTEEYWTPPRAGLMMGAGRNGTGGTLRGWEVMRIEKDAQGRISFLGSPEGAPPVRFPLLRSSAEEIVFANPGHDYPQRIRYWREGKRLHAEVSLADGSKAIRWNYSPADK